MSQAERDKWNARYKAGAYADREHPTRLLVDWLPRVSKGHALDVACGAGRNAIYLAQNGFAVDAVDISSVALERASRRAQTLGVSINWIEADLDCAERAIPGHFYELIVLVRYVDPKLYEILPAHLAPGGTLISEQHLRTSEDVIGPKSPEFRLPAGELRAAMASLDLIHYFEGLITDPDGRRAALAQVVARK